MHKAGAIIVLYYPEYVHLMQMLKSLSSDLEYIILVDNSEEPSSLDLKQFSNVSHHVLNANIGLASAQNLGLDYLKGKACDFAFVFDQDSTLSNSFVPSMLRAWESSGNENLAAIGPKVICKFKGTPEVPKVQRPYRVERGLHYVKQIISSGMLIDLRKLCIIGFKEDALFIDGVDHEWCWRAAKLSYVVAITQNVEMNHQMGVENKTIFGLSYKSGHPIRHYYQVRNVLLLLRRSYVPMYWKLRNSGMIFVRLILVILQGDNKLTRLKYIFIGFVDGLLGKSGGYCDR